MKQKTLEFLIEFSSNSNWKSSQLCLWRQWRIPMSSASQKICDCKSLNRACWFTNCEKLSEVFVLIFFNSFGWRSWRILKTSDFSDWKIPIGKAAAFAYDANRTLSYISLQFQGNFFEWGVFKSKQRVHSGTPELKKSWWGKAFQCCKRNLKSALKGIV